MAQPALIFIPDISGFTRFVTRTEIQHATHIISELIRVILESNTLDLKLSEIEGDAVLFYRPGPPPSTEELIDQARTMFVEFHRYLKVIHRDSICQCGACTMASGLSLKFVAHYGVLDEVRIQEFLKLMGPDVILAHRLLKNDVPGDEYLLVTDPLLDDGKGTMESLAWARFQSHNEDVPEFGTVAGAYVGLTPLLSQIPDPPERQAPGFGTGLSLSTNIEAPLAVVHAFVTDMEKRMEWVEGLKDIVGGEPINRVGQSHTCVFDGLDVDVMTLDHRVTQDGFVYSERGDAGFGFSLDTEFRLTHRNGVTSVDVTMAAAPPVASTGLMSSFVLRIRTFIVLRFTKRSIARGLQTLKSVCEGDTEERVKWDRSRQVIGS